MITTLRPVSSGTTPQTTATASRTNLALGLHAGYNDFENDKDATFLSADANGDVTDEYTDYSVSLTYTWAGVGFTLAYVGTDLDEEEYYGTDYG